MAAARSLILRHLRLAAAPSSAASLRPAASLQEALWGRRWMSSEETKGSFLDKSEVTDRIIKVVRNFQKIDDPSKSAIRNRGFKQLLNVDAIGLDMVLVANKGKGDILTSEREWMEGKLGNKNLKVTPDAHFKNDLGLDSLDAVEVVMALEEEFGFEIPDNEADKIDSIKVAVDFIASHPQAK